MAGGGGGRDVFRLLNAAAGQCGNHACSMDGNLVFNKSENENTNIDTTCDTLTKTRTNSPLPWAP